MNFLSLKYFLTVVEEKNITKAAERLYISQQSLSAHIKKLETVLGTELFERGPSLKLTYAGEKLEAASRKILFIKDEAEREIADIANGKRRQLTVGLSYTRGRAVLPEILPVFMKEHPFVEVSAVEGNTSELEDALIRGDIDIMIGSRPSISFISCEEIIQERHYLVVPKQFVKELFPENTEFMRGKFSESADIKYFASKPFLLLKKGNKTRTSVDELIERQGIEIPIIFESENIETLFSLAIQGIGITVYPEMFLHNIHPNINIGNTSVVDLFPLSGIPDDSIVIAFNNKRYLPTAATDFIKIAKLQYACITTRKQ